MSAWWRRCAITVTLGFFLTGCGVSTSQAPTGPAEPAGRPTAGTRQVDPQQAERLQRVMLPLLQGMNHPLPPNRVRIGTMDDPHINAANAGPGEFYVTTGLLQRANDDQLRAVMAHEIAHSDLGHVAKAQTLGAGLQIGAIILDQIFPGSGAITPIAGQLVANAYSRKEEYEADAHGVDVLRRAGYDGKALMVSTLSWLNATEGGGSGGFFATHPGTDDRIQAVQQLR